MKQFMFAGVNLGNKSRTSWKIWKIERKGKVVTAWWEPGRLHKRRLIPVSTANRMRSKTWRFRSEESARDDEQRRIQEKLRNGYQRVRRRAAK